MTPCTRSAVVYAGKAVAGAADEPRIVLELRWHSHLGRRHGMRFERSRTLRAAH